MFHVSGACEFSDSCVMSENYPQPYPYIQGNETCIVTMNQDASVKIGAIFDLQDYDHLKFTSWAGNESSQFLEDIEVRERTAVPRKLNDGEAFQWIMHATSSGTARGWKFCFEEPGTLKCFFVRKSIL